MRAQVKKSASYVCSACGASSTRWIGQCGSCGEWNSVSAVPRRDAAASSLSSLSSLPSLPSLAPLGEETQFLQRRRSLREVDRALGGGIVPGSVLLLGGDPGVGKSTLALQIAAALEEPEAALYISGEEQRAQIALRATRLDAPRACEVGCATSMEIDPILDLLRALPEQRSLLVVDSIQTMRSAQEPSAGSLATLRAITESLTVFARETGTAVLLIGHVTKEGNLAGPRQIEHMVDCVLYLEGERGHGFRILRAVKNRFGALDEIGVFEMTARGLRGVDNPSSLFLSERAGEACGTAVFAGVEGSRPFLCEVQALVAAAPPGTPRRTALGWDSARLATLLAVLETHARLRFGQSDVYVNISGGLRIRETACDLAVAAALVSAALRIPIPEGWVACGEIGLTGDARPIAHTRLRAAEACKLGFRFMLLPKQQKHGKSQEKYEKKITPSRETAHVRAAKDITDLNIELHTLEKVSDIAPWLEAVARDGPLIASA